MNTTILNETVCGFIKSAVESTSKTGARFASFTYTTQEGKTSRYTLLLGVNIEKMYRRDLHKLLTVRSSMEGIKKDAIEEMIASLNNSLEKGIGNNDNYTLKGYYAPLTSNGEVKYHEDENGEKFLYIRGYVTQEKVLVQGVYKKVNSRPLTLAKKEIEKMYCLRNKIRTFKINVNVLKSVKFNGMTMEIE